MQNIFKRLLILVVPFAVLTLISCTKEEIIIVEKEKTPRWKELDQFSHFGKIQLNSHSNEENLYILGINDITHVTKNVGWPDSLEISRYWLYHNNSVLSKMPITDDIFMGIEDKNIVAFYTCYNLGLNTHYKWIDLSDTDSLSFGVRHISGFRGHNIELNNAGRCLFPYTRTVSTPNSIHFMFIQYRIDKEAFIEQILVEQIDTFSRRPEIGGFIKIDAIDEYFFIVFEYFVYRVDKNMDIQLVYDGPVSDIILDGEKYVATGASGILYSYDEGLTWQKKAEEINDYFRYATYERINDTIVGFIESQVWSFDFGENEITIKELDNDGLAGNKITSLSKFENYIYVTSLSGVFRIRETDFFQYK